MSTEELPKGQQAKQTPEEKAAAKAAKEQEKLLKTVIKEGGKKGVEIEGASDMGGLDFFCTTIESPDGDVELLELAMKAMNAEPEEGAEDRKGCSGHVGKMIFSAGAKQLGCLAYVPDNEHNKSAEKIDITKWAAYVCEKVDGHVSKPAEKADSPMGGQIVTIIVPSDADKGLFALKQKDEAMKHAFDFLRENGAFPEDDGEEDEDECCFGDDAFDNIDEL